MGSSKARTKLRESLLQTILFDSGQLQHERERPDTVQKYMNRIVTRANYKTSKITSCDANRKARLVLSLRSLSTRVATGMM